MDAVEVSIVTSEGAEFERQIAEALALGEEDWQTCKSCSLTAPRNAAKVDAERLELGQTRAIDVWNEVNWRPPQNIRGSNAFGFEFVKR